MRAIHRRWILLLSVVLLPALLASTRPAPAAPPATESGKVAEILAKVREAVGLREIERQSGGILIEGKAERYGNEGAFSLRFLPSGEFVTRAEGVMGESTGFDGQKGWAVGWGGMPRILELENLELNQLAVWVPTGRWLAEEGPFEVELLEESDGDGTVTLGLKLRGGRLRARLEVDRATWLPATLRRKGVAGVDEWGFEAYRNDLGFKYPGRTTETIGTQTGSYEVRTITAASGPFPSVPPPPRDARFDAGASPEIAVKRAPTGHVLVRPRVDGADLGWFVLDTGAGQSAIAPAAAGKSRLERVGIVPLSSVYETALAAVYRGRSLTLGPVRIAGPFFVEMDLDFLTGPLGVAVSGIIGYDLISRCVVEIELARDSVKLFDPERYEGRTVPWRDLILHQKHPAVEARFEGERNGIFRLDLGAGGAAGNVLFHAPAVRELGLVGDRPVTRGEVGGQEYAAGRIAWFELAGHRFENPEVLFFLGESGPVADAYATGNIGARFLEPFRIILDYRRDRIALIEVGPARP